MTSPADVHGRVDRGGHVDRPVAVDAADRREAAAGLDDRRPG